MHTGSFSILHALSFDINFYEMSSGLVIQPVIMLK